MPGQTRARNPEAAPTQTTPASADKAPASNAEEQEKLRGKEGTDEGLAAYQASLGTWLGGELYKAVAPHLTLESLSKYATEGLSEALKGSVDLLKGLDGEVDNKAIAAFGKALAEKLGPLAGEWLEKDGQGLAAGLAGWVDANPRLVALIGLLAAAGAVAANMDIPEIKESIGITDELTADVSVKLGKLRQIALEQIKARLAYESGPLVAAIEVSRDEKGDVSGKAEAKLGDEERHLKADATVNEDGLTLWGVHGLATTDEGTVKGSVTGKKDEKPKLTASLTRKDGDVTDVSGVDYDANKGVLTLRNARTFDLGEGDSVGVASSASTDGTSSLSVNATNEVNDQLTLKGGVSSTTKDDETRHAASFGADWTSEDERNKAKLDLTAASDGTGKASGSFSHGKKDDPLKLSLNGAYDWGKDAFQLGGSASYEDEKNKLMANYAYDSGKDSHDLDLLAQRNLTNDLSLRASLGIAHSQGNTSYDAGLHGAYFLDDDRELGLIGGGRYQLDARGESHFIPEVGAQIKGVPLTLGYDSKNGSWLIGATIPF